MLDQGSVLHRYGAQTLEQRRGNPFYMDLSVGYVLSTFTFNSKRLKTRKFIGIG